MGCTVSLSAPSNYLSALGDMSCSVLEGKVMSHLVNSKETKMSCPGMGTCNGIIATPLSLAITNLKYYNIAYKNNPIQFGCS